MAGGNRGYTIEDVLGQLNTDSGASSTSDTSIQINLLGTAAETLGFNDTATATAGATSFKWDNGVDWGTLPWQ